MQRRRGENSQAKRPMVDGNSGKFESLRNIFDTEEATLHGIILQENLSGKQTEAWDCSCVSFF